MPLSRSDAAKFLNDHGYKIAASTMTKLACIGGGPPFRHFGRAPIYEPDDLLAWAKSKTCLPRNRTSEPLLYEKEAAR